MSKKKELNENQNLQEEVLFCRHYLLTGNKYESYIFAKKNNVPANEQSVRTLSVRYFKAPAVQRIMVQLEAEYLKRICKDLIQRGYKVFSPQDILTGKLQKFIDVYNSNIDPSAINYDLLQENNEGDQNCSTECSDTDIDGDESIINNNKKVENKFGEIADNLPSASSKTNDKPIDKATLRRQLNSMLKNSIDQDFKLKVISKIIDLDNMKKEEINEETNVLHYYLPYRECTDCPQRKVFIKNKEG